jgi:hypothetical protein
MRRLSSRAPVSRFPSAGLVTSQANCQLRLTIRKALPTSPPLSRDLFLARRSGPSPASSP